MHLVSGLSGAKAPHMAATAPYEAILHAVAGRKPETASEAAGPYMGEVFRITEDLRARSPGLIDTD